MENSSFQESGNFRLCSIDLKFLVPGKFLFCTSSCIYSRRYMAEILQIRRKTLSNQSTYIYQVCDFTSIENMVFLLYVFLISNAYKVKCRITFHKTLSPKRLQNEVDFSFYTYFNEYGFFVLKCCTFHITYTNHAIQKQRNVRQAN